MLPYILNDVIPNYFQFLFEIQSWIKVADNFQSSSTIKNICLTESNNLVYNLNDVHIYETKVWIMGLENEYLLFKFSFYEKGGSVAQWSELGIWIWKTWVRIPNPYYWMNLSLVILGANWPHFVSSQLVCLLPVGIRNWEREDYFNMTPKIPFGELSLGIFIYIFYFYFYFYRMTF